MGITHTDGTIHFNLSEDSEKAFEKICKDAFSKEEATVLTDEMIKLYNLMREMNTTKAYIQFKDGVKITCEIDLSEYHKDR